MTFEVDRDDHDGSFCEVCRKAKVGLAETSITNLNSIVEEDIGKTCDLFSDVLEGQEKRYPKVRGD